VLKTLLERRLIRITGRKPVVGKPFLYATTREFLMHFGLRDLEELPPLEEFEETFGEGGVPVEVGGAAAPADREERILRQAADLEEAAAEQSTEPLELEPR
jgi:segregation and condensation protein B